MEKLKEVYNLEIDNELSITLEIDRHGQVVIVKANEYIEKEEIEYDECTYCKPNIRFRIIPNVDTEEQVWYHLQQRDRIEKIRKMIDKVKDDLRKRGIR